jgi:hypothetical protein
MEPIQDDIDMVREALTALDAMPEEVAALDRLVAERDRLIQALDRVKDHAILVMAPQSVVDMIDEALTKT